MSTVEEAREQARELAGEIDHGNFEDRSWMIDALDRSAAAIRAFLDATEPPAQPDDEREAISAAIRQHALTTHLAGKVNADDLADVVLALGFRRSEVPEASLDWDRVHNRPADIYTPPEDRVARPFSEPQGEPSDDEVEELAAVIEAAQGELPEVDAEPDTAFELGRVAGYDEAMREVSPTDKPTEDEREALIAARKMVQAVLDESRALPLDVQSAQVMLVLVDAGYSKGPRPITPEMAEAAARVMFEPPSTTPDDPEYTWAEMVREDPSRADIWRADARAALEAAEGARR